MFTKILITSLLQVTLARHFVGPVLFLPSQVYGHQLNFRNPDSETYQVHRSNYGISDFSDHQPYPNGNHDHYERYVDPTSGVENQNVNVQQVPNYETEFLKNEYQLQGDEIRNERMGRDDAPYTNVAGSNQDPRRRSRKNKQTRNEQATLKTNLDFLSHAHSDNPDIKVEDLKGTTGQGTDYEPHSNDDSGSKSNNRFLVKAKPDSSPRIADSGRSSVNQSEVTDNNNITSIDNPKSTIVKSTDNEVKLTNGDEGDKDWIWSTPVYTTPVPDETTPGDLDDRFALGADDCPKGQAKIRGQCIATA